MTPRLTFIHTVPSLAPTFESIAAELDPGVAVSHVVDATLLADAIAAGEAVPEVEARLEAHARAALDDGAALVVVTCSSMGTATDRIADRRRWPILRIDEAMADAALAAGSRIGVVATLRSTLVPTVDLVRRRAGARPVELTPALAEGAFAALQAGDRMRHDELVRDAFRALLGSVDVVVLAQASMARVAETLGDEARGTPILASPRLGVARAIERVRAT